jgi:hypothetical protein
MKIFKQIKVIIYSDDGAESVVVQNEDGTRFEIKHDYTSPVKTFVQIETYLLNRINKVNKTCCQSLKTQELAAAQVYASDNFSRIN